MSCSFTLEHYRNILETALEAGYVFRGFHEPIYSSEGKSIYLRHDIDICLEEATEIARLEAVTGVRSTYFILINSPLYNLLDESSLMLLRNIQNKGHWIGLHIDTGLFPQQDNEMIERYISNIANFYSSMIRLVPVVSFHRPGENLLGINFQKFVSTYSHQFFKDIKYVSDSRGMWREGCPCQILKNRVYPSLQMLVHPIWWRSMETESMADRLRYLFNMRTECIKSYLSENIEPIGKLLYLKKQK